MLFRSLAEVGVEIHAGDSDPAVVVGSIAARHQAVARVEQRENQMWRSRLVPVAGVREVPTPLRLAHFIHQEAVIHGRASNRNHPKIVLANIARIGLIVDPLSK